MRLVVLSHKVCWWSAESPSGYATDGGFPFQMRALSELFESTRLVVPCARRADQSGEIALVGHNLSVAPLTPPIGSGFIRKLATPLWLVRNGFTVVREILAADAVHTPIPGDIGTIGLLMAFLLRKPLFVRYCGNWLVQRTAAERFWRWFMERFAGGRNVALATGGSGEPPSKNPSIGWVFSTSLTENELSECAATAVSTRPLGPRLITVCRQEPGKGIDVVIQSLPLIFDRFPEVTLDVVGDGSGLRDFKRLASSLGVEGRITFHGKLDHANVMSLLKRSVLFCYPTRSEGFPKVVLEALACGCPVITTPVSVLPQLMSTGCGMLIEEATPAAVANAVQRCIGDPQVYTTMSARAKETAWQYSLERWRDLIGETLRKAWGPLRSDA